MPRALVQIVTSLFMSLLVFTASAQASLCSGEMGDMGPDASPLVAGYTTEVEQVDFTEGHTLDLPAYIKKRLGQNYLEFSKRYQKFEIYIGDELTGRREAAAQGWTLKQSLKKIHGTQMMYAAEKADGTTGLIFLNIASPEEVARIQLMLKAINISAERVATAGYFKSQKENQLKAFKEWGTPPDFVVYGMSNFFLASLLGQRPLKNLQHYPNIIKGIMSRRFGDNADKQYPVYIVELANGKKLWLFSNLYGAAAGDLMSALSEFGVSNIAIIGAAGGLNPQFHVGDAVTPNYFNSNSNRRSLRWLKPVDGITMAGVYAKVTTPLVETTRWLDESEKQKIDLVDVELGSIIPALQANAQLKARVVFVISDVLTGPNKSDLSQTGINFVSKLNRAFQPVIQNINAALGISDGRIRRIDTKYFDTQVSKETSP